MKCKRAIYYLLFITIFVSLQSSITLVKLNMNSGNIVKPETINQIPEVRTSSSKPPFIYGAPNNPSRIDPVDIYTGDMNSQNVILQCLEPLVCYDLSAHPAYVFKPMLAESWVWENNKRISFKIRENVMFHDGTPLNAIAVKWNFERLMYFCNVSGTLPANETSWTAFSSSLYFLTDGTYIFKSFEVNGLYNFTINLNVPFGALLDLLTFYATYICSPASTPKHSYLNLAMDKVIGTGPFVYERYIPDQEVKFYAFNSYWGGKANIEELIFRIIQDDTARINAALTGQFDYVGEIPKDQVNTFKDRPDAFRVIEVGPDLTYFYLEIYCGPRYTDGIMIQPGNYQYQKNPPWLRRATALAINYSYIYEEIQDGYAIKGFPAVPYSMPGYNASVKQAHKYNWEENIVKARELLKSYSVDIVTRGGIDISGFDVNNDADWRGKNILGRKLEINRHFGSTINQRLNQLLADNLDLIGIQVEETIREWGDYIDTGEQTPWEMDLAYIGWKPDFLNAFNIIDSLFNLASLYCFSRINDTSTGGLTEMLIAGSEETDLDKQRIIWKNIQSYIFDVVRPLTPASHTHISVWAYLVQSVHYVDVYGFPYNVLGLVYFYPCYWSNEFPCSFDLSSDAGNPDTDGAFNLTWTPSKGARNFSVYTYYSNITYIDNNLTILAQQNATSQFPISGLSSGDYYYIVEAHGKIKNVLSNCINVVVKIKSKKLIPGYSVTLFITVIGMISIITIYDYCKKSKFLKKN